MESLCDDFRTAITSNEKGWQSLSGLWKKYIFGLCDRLFFPPPSVYSYLKGLNISKT